jgi:hypothetical protein
MLRFFVHRMFRETYRHWLLQSHRIQLDAETIEQVRQVAGEARQGQRSVITAVAHQFELSVDMARQWLVIVDIEAYGTIDADHLASETSLEPNQVESRPPLFLRSVCAGHGISTGWRDTDWEATLRDVPEKAHQGCLGHAFATYNLCKHCFQYYGRVRSRYPRWLLHLIRSNEREQYHNTKEFYTFTEEAA